MILSPLLSANCAGSVNLCEVWIEIVYSKYFDGDLYWNALCACD